MAANFSRLYIFILYCHVMSLTLCFICSVFSFTIVIWSIQTFVGFAKNTIFPRNRHPVMQKNDTKEIERTQKETAHRPFLWSASRLFYIYVSRRLSHNSYFTITLRTVPSLMRMMFRPRCGAERRLPSIANRAAGTVLTLTEGVTIAVGALPS